MPLSPPSLTLPEHALLLLTATDCHCWTHTQPLHIGLNIIMWTVNKQWCPSAVDGWMDVFVHGWRETYQVRAHVPVSRECTSETERFFHFQKCISSCFTTFGTGSLCRSLWVILKSREHTNTEGPGWLLSTGSRASILLLPTSTASPCLDSRSSPLQ